MEWTQEKITDARSHMENLRVQVEGSIFEEVTEAILVDHDLMLDGLEKKNAEIERLERLIMAADEILSAHVAYCTAPFNTTAEKLEDALTKYAKERNTARV